MAVLVDDLVEWRRSASQPTPTGIQRVAFGVLDAALSETEIRAWPAASIVGLRSDDARLVEINRKSLRWDSPEEGAKLRLSRLRAVRSVAARLPLPPQTRTLAKRVYGRLTIDALGGGSDAQPVDLLIVPGAFWIGDTADWLPRLVDHGIPVRVIVYDVYPLTRPEWFVSSLRDRFGRAIDAIIPKCDRIVTLSDVAAHELLARYPSVADRVRSAVPHLHAHAPNAAGRFNSLTTPPNLLPTPYILAVSTVEPRKNHRLILEAWRLYRGRMPMGSLVVVGRRGWEASEIEDEMRRNAGSLNLVRIESATDTELEALYAGCAATVHASWTEGFGLPVRESVARGIPTLVSSGIPRDGLPDDRIEVFAPEDPVRLSWLMQEALHAPLRHGPVAVSEGTGWEPVLSALLD